MPQLNPLGLRKPKDTIHIERHRLTIQTPFTVNRALKLPTLQTYYDVYNQGAEGSCVGFGSSWAMTLLNRVMYAARELYVNTQLVDEWEDTPPEEGTSVRAAMDVLRKQGHWRLKYDQKLNARVMHPVSLEHGIEANKWATSVDEARACIAAGTPVVTGFNWYRNFDNPVWDPTLRKWWVGRGNLGSIRGGHCVCFFAAWDRLEAFEFINNWGAPVVNPSLQLIGGYPKTLMPYTTFERLLKEDGEVTLITDRQGIVRIQGF